MTYHQYLQAREFSDSIQFEISTQAKALIASNNRALSAQMEQIQEIGKSQADAMVMVSQSIGDLRQEMTRGFDSIGSILEYGFSDLIFAATRTNDLLAELLQTVKTPSQTWAYEQFDIGRNAFRRGLFDDALQSVNLAIDGFHGNVGFKSEHRFHFLRGIILLGDFRNNSPKIVDLAQAEAAFRLAAKYAQHDEPDEAGLALLYAARTANLQGKYDLALELANQAEQNGPYAAVLYERAVAQIELGRRAEAREDCKDALCMDRNLLLKAAGDPHFATREEFLNGVLAEIRDENYDHVKAMHEWCKAQLHGLADLSFRSTLTGKTINLKDQCADVLEPVQRWLEAADSITRSSAIMDSFSVIDSFGAAYTVLANIDGVFRQRAVRELREFEEQAKEQQDGKIRKIREIQSQFRDKLTKYPIFAAIGMGALVVLSAIDDSGSSSSLDRLILVILGAPFFSWMAYWSVTGIVVMVSNAKEGSTRTEIEKLKQIQGQFSEKGSKDYSTLSSRSFYQPDKAAKDLLPWYVFE